MAQFIFEFTEKMILAFEWDLRNIDGATHFQGIAMKFEKKSTYVCQTIKIC